VKRRVIWSDDALDDRGDTLEFLAQDDLAAALGIIDKLETEGNQLGAHATGRPGRVARTFEKSLPRLRYIIAFSIDDREAGGVITILHVIHGARN
jgi:plasmid stabilization system protein ParE